MNRGKTRLSATLYTINVIRTFPESKQGLRGETPETRLHLNYICRFSSQLTRTQCSVNYNEQSGNVVFVL